MRVRWAAVLAARHGVDADAAQVNQERMLNEQRRMFVVVSTAADFITPARFDDRLVVTASLVRLTRASFDIAQDVFRDSAEGELLLKSTVRAAFLDADSLKPQRIPKDLFEE